MGIEPTDHMISIRPNGFEDRDQHQLSKHFQIRFAKIILYTPEAPDTIGRDLVIGRLTQKIAAHFHLFGRGVFNARRYFFSLSANTFFNFSSLGGISAWQ